ncbi:unnamed protein product [Caenorhabditis sp. 36 PRJEB53466]|nr:unnamed protein product [Caenorhabditis sp. 36 PRJEB53466]
MSAVVRLLLLAAICSTVLSYSVLPGEVQRSRTVRFWQPLYDREILDEVIPSDDVDGRMKRGFDDDFEQQLSKRTNLKRLVILSARGFGRK